jgi:UDP-apiose/xylose synthase
MQVVVLGAGGFIGSHMVQHLLHHEEHGIVSVDVSDDKLEGIAGPAFTFHRANTMGSPKLLEELVRAGDIVVDLVAYANPSIYVESPLEVYRLNFEANLEIVNYCIRHQKRLIQYSTAEIYGKPAEGITEYSEESTDFVYGPVTKQRWIYAAAKQLLERVIHAHGLRGDLEYTIIRPFNFVGARFDYLVDAGTMGGPRVFAHYMSALLQDGPMYLVDGGEQMRTFTHILDANEAFQTLIDHPDETRNEAYNIGNPANNISIRGLAELMREIYQEMTGRESGSELIEVSGEEFYGRGYEDTSRVPPDVSKLGALGWSPSRDLHATFSDAMAVYLREDAQNRVA